MKVNIDENSKINSEKYTDEDLDIAYKFAKRVHKEFGSFIRAVVIFGSLARQIESGTNQMNKFSDIDILVIVDDVRTKLTPELVEAYRIITERIIYETSPKLHVTSLKFSHFWEYVRVGDPVALNVLRDGFSLIDTGFFEPLQLLLKQGRIRPSREAVWAYYSKAPLTLSSSKMRIMKATLDLYWAVIDSAHAALMSEDIVPGTPNQVSELLNEVFVKNKRLDKKYVKVMDEFYKLSKRIIYREVKEISASEYETYYKKAKDFVDKMHELILKKKI